MPKKFPNAEEIRDKLEWVVTGGKELTKIFGEGEKLGDKLKTHAKSGEAMARKLVEDMGCSYEVAKDLSVLTLYNLVILIDDSDSMVTEEGGARQRTLVRYIDSITRIYKLADGILALRFLNANNGIENWAEESSKTYLDNHSYGGLTRLGTELEAKILDEFVYRKDESAKQIKQIKPLLVLVITDGAIEGERKGYLKTVIQDCVNERHKAGKGQGAVAFQFSHVGDDPEATQLLRELDRDKELGAYIDTLPVEVDLERQIDEDKWFVLPKILLGAILPDWDDQDYYGWVEQQNYLGKRAEGKEEDDGNGSGWEE